MTLRGFLAALAVLSLAFLAPRPAAAEDARDCSVPEELTESDAKLPHLAQRLAARQPVTIVAIGSSSTAGTAAPSPEETYPSRLQQELARRYPETAIKVVNKGVPRQSARDMAERFAADVVAERPALTIWETGTAEAVRGVDIEDFEATLQSGIEALRAQNIEVVLIDMQYSRRTASVIGFERYLEAMRQLSERDEVTLFRRFEIMKFWSESGVFDFEDVPMSDRAALAGAVYGCLAQRLADVIGNAVQ
jgi:acyl-CoA thioesterase-1